MNVTPKFVFVFIISILVIGASFTLLSWFLSFSGVFFVQDLFSIANPLGVVGVILILIVGGFYLFKIGFTILKNSL